MRGGQAGRQRRRTDFIGSDVDTDTVRSHGSLHPKRIRIKHEHARIVGFVFFRMGLRCRSSGSRLDAGGKKLPIEAPREHTWEINRSANGLA